MKALNTKAGMIAAGVLAAGVVLYFIGRKLSDKAGDAAAAVGNAINPTNPENVFHSGVNATGAAISGDKDWTLGGWVYDLFHKPYDPNAPTKKDPDSVAYIKLNSEVIR